MRRLFINARSRLRFAAKHPSYALKSMFRELTLADERFLAQLTGRDKKQIRAFLEEPFDEPGFLDHLKDCARAFPEDAHIGADFYAKKVLLQYAVVRALRPDVVLETGVANGVSSTYLLLALEKNGSGRLWSIDVDDGCYLPPGKKTGWMVPERFRHRWEFHPGDSLKLLPSLLERLPLLDLFLHDSLHTYEHMMFEFRQAYPRLRPGGILIADDALWNSSLNDFAREVGAQHSGIIRGVGLLKKRGPKETSL
jgi:predicted O-methyltransferase YrrM